jgi:uncharacterized protein (DUF111 family)
MDDANMSDGSGMVPLHAHWDCSNGVSSRAILAACLGAARDANQTLEWIDAIEELISEVFQRDTGIIVGIDIQRVPGNESIKIEYHGDLEESSDWTWSRLCEMIELQEDVFSPWVFEKSRAVLLQLMDAEHEVKEVGIMTYMQFLFFLAEIVGSLYCLDRLGVRTVSCSPLPLSTDNPNPIEQSQGGKAHTHTRVTEQLLRGMAVSLESSSPSPVVTETSVALLRVLTGVASASSSSDNIATATSPQPPMTSPPPMTLRSTSNGTNMLPVPHRVRLFIGETLTTPKDNVQRDAPVVKELTSNLWKVNRMMLLETNIDDMSGEHLAFCVDQLLLAGAADAWVTPIVMKKGRAAHTLHCLCREDQTDVLLPVVFRNSTTLGVRTQSIDRVALERKMFTVQTEWIDTVRKGLVEVKVGYLGAGKVVSVKAEFDHCKEIALEVGIPIQSVADQAVQKAKDMQQQDGV